MRYIASFRFHYGSANGSQSRFASVRTSFFRPTPSCELSPACGPHIIPRPQAGGRANRYRLAGASDDTICLLSAYPSAHSRCSFAIARSCSFLLASAHSRSLPPICGVPLHVPPPDTESGKRIPFRLLSARSPASIDMGKAGRGYRLADFSPPRPFRLSCLHLRLFSYFPGMVMGYSVATVMYFP